MPKVRPAHEPRFAVGKRVANWKKPNFMRDRLTLLLVATCAALGTYSAPAAVKYWDLNGVTAGAGGPSPAGTWNTTALNWSTSSAGTAATVAFAGGGVDNAVFAAGTDA